MAEIRLEEKKSNAWIGWLLGLVLLALLIWGIIELTGDDDKIAESDEPENTELAQDEAYVVNDDNPENDMDVAQNNSMNEEVGAVSTFHKWVENGDMEMGKHHEATHKGITALAAALKHTAQEANLMEEMSIKEDLQSMKSMADDITENWKETTHADKIHKSFVKASEIIESMQEEKFEDMSAAVNDLKEMANQVDPAVHTLDQKEAVKDFFEKADEILVKMNDKI